MKEQVRRFLSFHTLFGEGKMSEVVLNLTCVDVHKRFIGEGRGVFYLKMLVGEN